MPIYRIKEGIVLVFVPGMGRVYIPEGTEDKPQTRLHHVNDACSQLLAALKKHKQWGKDWMSFGRLRDVLEGIYGQKDAITQDLKDVLADLVNKGIIEENPNVHDGDAHLGPLSYLVPSNEQGIEDYKKPKVDPLATAVMDVELGAIAELVGVAVRITPYIK